MLLLPSTGEAAQGRHLCPHVPLHSFLLGTGEIPKLPRGAGSVSQGRGPVLIDRINYTALQVKVDVNSQETIHAVLHLVSASLCQLPLKYPSWMPLTGLTS